MSKSRWTVPLCIAAAVFLFYAIPLLSPDAGIQGDAANAHYPLQKYFAERWRTALPQWTPYIYSGYPFLANPKTGAWYPLNWPFFLAGVTPRAIQAEIALHALIACVGAWLLFGDLLKHRPAAALGALAYGFSGFFTAHSSHLGLMGAAAWFPWVLLAYRRAVRVPALRNTLSGAAVAAMMTLAGSIQGSAYGMIGLALFAAADRSQPEARWAQRGKILAAIALGAAILSAIQIVPGFELMQVSLPDSRTAGSEVRGVLGSDALLSVVFPKPPAGDSGARQFWLYGGLLTLPLAALGLLKHRPLRWTALALAVPALWYMAGPALGLYRAVAALPLLREFQNPVRSWFVVALALALLAAAGVEWLLDSGRIRSLAGLLCLALFADLWYVNSFANPLAYARQGFEQRYGKQERLGKAVVAAPQLPLTRFEAARQVSGMGPMLHPLDLKFETTYGYLRLQPRPMREYIEVLKRNPQLRDGLNVERYVDTANSAVAVNGSALPRAYFPRAVQAVRAERDSLQALESLQPVERSVALYAGPPLTQDPHAEAIVTASGEQSYTIAYSTASPSLLKLAVAWYPGWRAELGGRQLPVIRVDHAMMGVVAPAGSGRVRLYFEPRWFLLGAGLTIGSCLSVLGLVLVKTLRQRFNRKTVGLKRRTRARAV